MSTQIDQFTYTTTFGTAVTFTIEETPAKKYRVTAKLGDKERSCEWGILNLCYEWAQGYMILKQSAETLAS